MDQIWIQARNIKLPNQETKIKEKGPKALDLVIQSQSKPGPQ